MTGPPIDIDVRFEPDHDAAVTIKDGRPLLQWGRHQEYGNGWLLFYLEDDSPTAGVDGHFIPGDLTDVDEAVESARRWLLLHYGRA